MSGSGVAVVAMRKVVPQNSQVAKSFFRDAAERVPPQLGQVSAFMMWNYTIGKVKFRISIWSVARIFLSHRGHRDSEKKSLNPL